MRSTSRWLFIGLAAAVLGTALTGCGKPAAKLQSDVTQVRMTSPDGQPELLLVPPTETKRLVVFMHGFDADQDQLITTSGLFALRDALLSAGWAIATSDAHGNNVGNTQSLADQRALFVDAQRKLGTLDSIAVLGFSMGGLDALRAASVAPKSLQAVVLLSPVTDLVPFASGKYAGVIAWAYAADTQAAVTAASQANSPGLFDASMFKGTRYQFWHSPADTVVPEQQSTAMVTKLQGAGIEARLDLLDGDHGDFAKLDPASVVAFLEGR